MRNFRIDAEKAITPEEALGDYINFKRADGRRESTLNDYKRFVMQFYRAYPDAGFDERALESACMHFLGQKVSSATYNLRLTYLRGFFDFCVEEKYLTKNPMERFSVKRTNSRIVDVPTKILVKLMELPDKKTFVGFRDYCLFLLTLDTGIRPGEAFQLLPSDFLFKASQLSIREEVSKTKTPRVLSLSNVTTQAIHKLVNHRRECWDDRVVPVFCTPDGKPLNKDTWGDRLEFYSDRLGFKIRPYDLRHCFALNYLRGGGSPFGLQKTLGHVDLDMTKTYVALTQEDLQTEQRLKKHPTNADKMAAETDCTDWDDYIRNDRQHPKTEDNGYSMSELLESIKPKLSEQEFNVLTDRIEGLDYKEIGQKRGYTTTQIDNALRRIKQKATLHKLLD